MARQSVGIDFGTTNSAVAVAEGGQDARLATYSDGEREWTTFRSVLYFDPEGRPVGGRARAVAGPRAIRRYLEAEEKGRLIQSIKSFLASRSFTETQIFNHTYTVQALVAIILRQLLTEAASSIGQVDGPVVLGRPVRFAGSNNEEQDGFAETRLREAAALAGLKDVVFEFEPVAAAYEYQQRLDHDELVLIGDFGGGTSDFTLVRLGPSSLSGDAGAILGNDGLGLAGDAFDSRIVREAVAPHLGRGMSYASLGKRLEMPSWIYQNLERWHYVSFLKSRKTVEMLRGLRAQVERPERVDALVHLVEHDLGFAMYRAVDMAKCGLSKADAATLDLYDPPLEIEETLERDDFEDWIRDDVRSIATCVDGLLSRCGVAPADVNTVFLTGGSSLVPMVRRYFERRFGAAKVRGGDELTTVAKGLALRAAQL
jgi:hypothetical chaperone protein